jgi:hypothetical protein
MAFKRRNNQSVLIAVMMVILLSGATTFIDSLLLVARLTIPLYLAQALVLSPVLIKFPLLVVSLSHLINANSSLQF